MAYSAAVDPVLAPGELCGGNEVVRLLGAGGFAQVYEVRDRTGTRRALKILDAEADARPKLRARLAQEGAALALLDHANVVRLFDAGVDGERIYLLLELVEGKTLREVQRAHAGRLPAETAVRWVRQAATGVGEAHRRGIVHRDLKPENLLVTPQEVVKVIDFGIAKLTGWGVRTTQDQKVGTALYMSPEHIRGAEPDPRMDVYALGLILYEALAGKHPIAPEPATVYQICVLQLTRQPQPLGEVVPGIPAELGAAVDRAVEKDPALRFPDAATFADALHVALLVLTGDRVASLRDAARALPLPLPPAEGSGGGGSPFIPSSRLAATESMRMAPAEERGRGSVTAPPAVRASPPARHTDPAAALVVAVGVILGVACGVWLALRVLPWPF